MADEIFLTDNPYGFRVNISHPTINPLYERFKKWKGIPDHFPLSDAERLEFEEYVLKKVKKQNAEIGILP